jgi:hypothetical protein
MKDIKKGSDQEILHKFFSFFLTFKLNYLFCNPVFFNHNQLGRQKRLSVLYKKSS